MRLRHVPVLFLLFVAAAAQGSGAEGPSSYLEQAGFEMASEGWLTNEPLLLALQEIEARSTLRPVLGEDRIPRIAMSGDTSIVELRDQERPWETTFLFYPEGQGPVLFLRVSSTLGEPEVRLWSQGPSEIVLSKQGGKLLLNPSPSSFRFDRSFGAGMEKISRTDALACLARILGLESTNWNSFVSVLTNMTCSNVGSTAFDAVQTILHCASMVSVGVANVTSTAGCIVGMTKLIGCGALSCASSPSVPSGLSASDGTLADRIRVTWNPTQGATSYTLYRSQSAGSTGSVLTTTSSTSYDDYSAQAGYRYYYYRVKACSTLGCSDVSGYDQGWRASSGSTNCSGTTYTGTLAAGASAVQPNGTYYQSSVSGRHSARLTGPSGTDFDLYLYRWNGSSWVVAARSSTTSNVETLSYSGAAGSYYWRVHAYRGSGSYTLCISRP